MEATVKVSIHATGQVTVTYKDAQNRERPIGFPAGSSDEEKGQYFTELVTGLIEAEVAALETAKHSVNGTQPKNQR